MKSIKTVFLGGIALLLLSALLAACSNGGGGGSPAPAPITLGSVAALYPNNGGSWNDYVKNDGADRNSATDTACDPATDGPGYDACIHGGEARVFEVIGKSSCSGLTAEDDIGAFDWSCDASTNPVRMVSTGLKHGKNLSDLIDFDAPAWKANSVTVRADGAVYGNTPSSVWWTNPMVVDNNGMTAGEMNAAGTIYLVTADATGSYVFGADKQALVIRPGATLSGPGPSGIVISAQSRSHIWIEGSINAVNDLTGVSWNGVVFSVLRNTAVSNGTDTGVLLAISSNNKLSDMTATSNGDGLDLNGACNNNTLLDITADNNWTGVLLYGSSNNTLSNVTASNSRNEGVHLSNSSNTTLSNVLASNSGGHGVYLFSSSNNKLSNVTASNNAYDGVGLGGSSSDNTLMSITAANNAGGGIVLGFNSNNTLLNMTASNNGGKGISLFYSSSNYFTGLLKVGNNATSNCFVFEGTNPGLDDDTCENNGSSNATLTTGITLASSFVGKAGSDSSNAHGAGGTMLYDDITDWTSFDNQYRGWGIDGSAFPNANHQGRCTILTLCRIWDWSLAGGDTVIRNALALPTGNDTLSHTWSGGSTIMLLRNAVEIMGDGIGNDNGLCESNETCLYTPNIGSYQGHGSLVSAGAFTNGAITGVTLMKYATNGR